MRRQKKKIGVRRKVTQWHNIHRVMGDNGPADVVGLARTASGCWLKTAPGNHAQGTAQTALGAPYSDVCIDLQRTHNTQPIPIHVLSGNRATVGTPVQCLNTPTTTTSQRQQQPPWPHRPRQRWRRSGRQWSRWSCRWSCRQQRRSRRSQRRQSRWWW